MHNDDLLTLVNEVYMVGVNEVGVTRTLDTRTTVCKENKKG